jgi:hypothetical protein
MATKDKTVEVAYSDLRELLESVGEILELDALRDDLSRRTAQAFDAVQMDLWLAEGRDGGGRK